jgi:hypothetical protein
LAAGTAIWLERWCARHHKPVVSRRALGVNRSDGGAVSPHRQLCRLWKPTCRSASRPTILPATIGSSAISATLDCRSNVRDVPCAAITAREADRVRTHRPVSLVLCRHAYPDARVLQVPFGHERSSQKRCVTQPQCLQHGAAARPGSARADAHPENDASAPLRPARRTVPSASVPVAGL